jgi:predicted esterase
MRFLILLLFPVICSAKSVELGFPDLAYRVKVTLPDNHDPSKKYPAIFYYHGIGGKPDTSLMRGHVDGREWIVVGMTYYQQEGFSYTPEALKKERVLLQSVRRNLAEKRGLDQKRCYVAGFSKGGWMADLLLQAEPSLAGGVILGAGHLYKAGGNGRGGARKSEGRPVFVGVGRLDGNFPFALRAVVYHRSLGARTTFEAWHGLKHALPKDGSTALQQWFSMRVHPAAKLKSVARVEMLGELAASQLLDPYPQWMRLRQLRDYPYSRILGAPWKKSLDGKITALELVEPVKKEAGFLRRHRKLLIREIKEGTVIGMAKINIGYQELIGKASTAKQADLARHDHQRVQQLYLQFKEQDQKAKPKPADPVAPLAPKDPERRRRIPGNPLVR